MPTKSKITPASRKKPICYGYVSKTNALWYHKEAYEKNVPASQVINAALNAARKGEIYKIEPKTPRYLAQAERVLAKRKLRLKKFV